MDVANIDAGTDEISKIIRKFIKVIIKKIYICAEIFLQKYT